MQGPCTPFPSLGSPSDAGFTGTPMPTPGTRTLHPRHPEADAHPQASGLPNPCAPRHDVTRCHGNAAASLRCNAPQPQDFRRGCVAWAAGWGAGTPGGVWGA